MPFRLIAPPEPVHCEPLTLSRSLGECQVAGKHLRQWQTASAEAADLATELNLFENVHADETTLRLIGGDPTPRRLIANGQWIGWIGSALPSVSEIQDLGSCPGINVIRYAWDLLSLHEKLMGTINESKIEGEIMQGATIDGILVMAPGARILPGVYVEGVLVVGASARIGPNAYLRGYNSIGERCLIGQSVEIKNSIIYPGTFISHLAYCGDSIIGEAVNIGAGTIISNFRHDGANHRSSIGGRLIDTGRQKFGAIIGDQVHTGINTSIYPGRKIWPDASTLPASVIQRDIITV